MKYYLLFIITLIPIEIFSQKINLKTFSSKKIEYLNDSNLLITKNYPFETTTFYPKFYKVFYNKKNKILNISGQVFDNKNKTVGCSDVVIFNGYRNGNYLNDTINLGKSSLFFNQKSNSGGFFKISFKVKRKMKLYFYRQFSLLKEYNISKLLSN